jgi:PPM family protein phosphatase
MISSLLTALNPFAPSTQPPSSHGTIPIVYSDEDEGEEEEATRGGGAAVRRLHVEDAAYDAPTGMHPIFDLRAGGRSHAGMKRPNNEDAMLLLDEEGLYVVADGMGGHQGGEVASRLAVDAMATTFLEEGALRAVVSNVPPRAVQLVQGFAAANEAVRYAAAQNRVLAEMGTTVVAARFCPKKGRVYVGHVGDSRCYRLRDGQLERVTRDHTMAELGFVGREAQRLSRAVGSNGIVEADLAVLEPRNDDVFLLCSDGINKTLSDETILEVLGSIHDPEAAANELIARANALGARDNVTAIVVRIRNP